MRRDIRQLLVAVGLALTSVACAPDFAAVLHVTLDGPELAPGAGYWIDLRQPDGAPLGGLAPTFVDFKPGKQDVTLVLKQRDLFQGSSTFVARLFVAAAPGEEAAVIAQGAKLVTLKREEVVEAKLTLQDDPRPLNADVVVTYDAGAAAFADERLSLDVAALPSDDTFAYHLWLEDDVGDLVWLSALEPASGSIAIDPRTQTATVEVAGVQLLLTAEPIDSPAPLVASSGWPILRGGISAELSGALFAAPGAPLGVIAAMLDIVGVAEQHGGLSLDAFTNGSSGSVRAHGEHVYALVAGEAVASQGTPMAGDLDENGVISFVFADHTGLGLGVVPDAPGYLHAIDALVSRLEQDGANVGALDACRQSFAIAIDGGGTGPAADAGTLNTVAALAADTTNAAAADDFDCSLKRLRGDDSVTPRNPANCSISPALECIWQQAESFAGFSLTALGAGEL